MPLHMFDLLKGALAEVGQKIESARVTVLGYAYLEDSDDTRNSPSEVLVRRLREMGVDVVIHDPWVEEYRGDLMKRIKDCDAIVVMVAHSVYRTLDMDALKKALRTPVLVDGRHVFDKETVRMKGFIYRSIGQDVTRL